MPDTNAPLIVLDLETTGLDHRTERIIEFGAVRMENDEVVDSLSMLINPEVPIRHSSFKIHGISEDMVKDAPTIDKVMPDILEFIGDFPFVAHNAIFDYSFLNEAMKRLYEKRLPNHRIDTFDMYRCVFPDAQSHGLSSLLERFGFESHVSHRALDDAENLAKVYPKLRKLYEEQHQFHLSQLGNIPYLVERYQRLQNTVQLLQSEMSELREIFKLHFKEGGNRIEATSGETMVSSYRRLYEYDEDALRQVIEMAALEDHVFKLNLKAVDRLIDKSDIDDDIRNALKDTRVQMSENRVITFLKPTPREEPSDNGNDKPSK